MADKEQTNTEEKIETGKTVRKRKKGKASSTQRYLPIAEIRNDTVILKNGGIRAVLQADAINFNLKSETEQQGIIAGYQSFMNTLTFPLQIVARSRKLNIDPYINNLRVLARDQENLLLKRQIQTYATFVETIVDIADIMQKKFYVVVPIDDSEEKKSALGQFMSWFGNDDTTAKVSQRNKKFPNKERKLRDRLNLVEAGLHNVGLNTRRLNTRELIEMYYEIYNPKTSQEQKLPYGSLNTKELVL